MSRENWERLVAAVLDREHFRQLCFEHSRSPSISTISSDTTSDLSRQILSFSSNKLEAASTSPSASAPLTNSSVSQVRNNADSSPITRKLFSAWHRRRKRKDKYLANIPEDRAIHVEQIKRFSLHELQVATDNFSRNIIGYGKVYKGRLADGSPVAVKRCRGNVQTAEFRFQREVEISSIAAHQNVLHVLGFCITEKERLLVYPFMPNGSVASRLRDRHESEPPLNWLTRKRIALGAARGLAYLHYECNKKIIHRNVKAENILLDEDFEAVVADFELGITLEHDATDVEEMVCGTVGHIAPEYISTSKCSEKADVFGYGVFLCELITGQRTFDINRLHNDEDIMLLEFVKEKFRERKWEKIVDPACGGNYILLEVKQLTLIALLCTQSSPVGRPNMSEVVSMLEDGDGLAERWEERLKEIYRRNIHLIKSDSIISFDDTIFNLSPAVADMSARGVWRFSLHELQVATNNFRDKDIIGYGHNTVYKGRLADGSQVVVKRHKDRGGSQTAEVQFQTELEINSISLHPNVLHMLGFCITSDERLIVYPLLANGSVASWLRGRHESRPLLDWSIRKGIALGAARGLAYLHNKCDPQIIHRDINATNILLDEDFEAVVGDFELAIIMDYNLTQATTSLVGTSGHIAPEYVSHGICSDKTDVYGYGAFLLELITGQRIFELAGLDWVQMNLKERKWEMLADPYCGGNHMEEVVEQLTKIALLCRQSTPQRRPKTSEIVRMLEFGDLLSERWEQCCDEEMFSLDVENGSFFISGDDISGPR